MMDQSPPFASDQLGDATAMSRTSSKPAHAQPAGTIVQIGPELQREAVAALLGDRKEGHSGAKRFLDYARENHVPLECMWSLVDGRGAIEATVLGVPSPGRTAMIFATPVRQAGSLGPIARLIDHACISLGKRDVELAQALLDPGDHVAKSCFIEAAFTLLAQLSYMQRPIRASDATVRVDWPDGYSAEPFDGQQRAELVALLEATYIDTLDCPGLVGLREAADILAGHECVGDKAEHRWLVLRNEGEAVGVVMLNPSPASDTVELVYLGLSPQARGKSLASKLLRAGLAHLGRRKERTITLAVDQRNRPAVSLYEREGFRVALERIAMIRSLRSQKEAGN